MSDQPEMIDGLPTEVVNTFDRLVRAELQRLRLMKVLECDEAFAEYCRSISGLKYGPFVRASIYGNRGEPLNTRDYFGSDPRRPVVMRGALNKVKAKFGTRSGYIYHVTHRYLKKIGFTAFRIEETDAMNSVLCEHIRRRNHEWNRHSNLLLPAVSNENFSQAWVGGELRHVTRQEWLELRRNNPPSIIIRRKKHELIVRPRALNPPPVEATIVVPDYKLTLKQKKTAAYRALKELGIHI